MSKTLDVVLLALKSFGFDVCKAGFLWVLPQLQGGNTHFLIQIFGLQIAPTPNRLFLGENPLG